MRRNLRGGCPLLQLRKGERTEDRAVFVLAKKPVLIGCRFHYSVGDGLAEGDGAGEPGSMRV